MGEEMKYLIITIIIVIAASMVLKPEILDSIVLNIDILNPEPVKIYKSYREKIMAAKGYSSNVAARSKWSIKINKYTREDTKAIIMATERTSKIPQNNTSHIFATKVTRQIKVAYFLQHGKWNMGTESILKESTSTYEDRK